MSSARQEDLDEIAKRLAVKFSDRSLLDQALTHSSYAAEYNVVDFERLEFFGDAVLKFVVSEFLFSTYPQMHEGELTQVCAVLISAKTLESIGRTFDLDRYIRVGKGVPMRSSIIARSMEAILGALYMDSQFDQARPFIVEHFCSRAQAVALDDVKENYKAQLQQWTQARAQGTPVYAVMTVEGPPHDPIFQVSVSVEQKVIAEGKGRSKKIAEQAAARAAMQKLSNGA